MGGPERRRFARFEASNAGKIISGVEDQEVVGRVGRVTGTIAPGRLGEVMVAIRGGSEAFHAYAMDPKEAIQRGTRIFVVEYFPPRTVVVSLA
jgi:hypothetical protein